MVRVPPAAGANWFDMIVCSCNVISDQEIADAIVQLRKEDPLAVITPGVVFKKLGKRPNCGGCLPLFARTMLQLDPDPPRETVDDVTRFRLVVIQGRR